MKGSRAPNSLVLLLFVLVELVKQEAKLKIKLNAVGSTATKEEYVPELAANDPNKLTRVLPLLLGVLARLLRLLRVTARVTKGTLGKQLVVFWESSGQEILNVGILP